MEMDSNLGESPVARPTACLLCNDNDWRCVCWAAGDPGRPLEG